MAALIAAKFEDVVRRFAVNRQVGPISFDVPEGVCCGLLGANGAGKTTLMRMLLGIDRPTGGSVELFGEPIRVGRPPIDTSGMIEEPRFFEWLSASDNLRACFDSATASPSRISSVLRRVGLDAVGRQPVRGFSQGMRQRLGLARVLLSDPRFLVLDEPTNGLDPSGIRWLRSLIRELVDEGRTVLVSSHMLHEVQLVADMFIMIDQGRVVASGRATETSSFGNLEDLYFHHAGQTPAP